jgi:hypothetical protein
MSPRFHTGLHAEAGAVFSFHPRLYAVIGRPPAEADLQRFFQVTPPSVHQMVLTLERNRLIQRPA